MPSSRWLVDVGRAVRLERAEAIPFQLAVVFVAGGGVRLLQRGMQTPLRGELLAHPAFGLVPDDGRLAQSTHTRPYNSTVISINGLRGETHISLASGTGCLLRTTTLCSRSPRVSSDGRPNLSEWSGHFRAGPKSSRVYVTRRSYRPPRSAGH